MKIAIFADIHGKILLPFKMVDYYQKITGEKIDFILQCGDVGIYPDMEKLDKATLKHAMNDRDELGFYDYFTCVNKEIKDYLNELDLYMYCVRGNHEDHDYLDELEQRYSKESVYPVDAYQRVWVFKSAHVQEFEVKGETLSIIGIGRIGDHKQRNDRCFIQEYEHKQVKKLINSVGMSDILITHDKAESSHRGYGLAEIREVLDNIFVKYHFYGHTGEDYSAVLDDNEYTTSVKIKELEFRKEMLPDNCMVILKKSGAEITINPVSNSITNMFTKSGWMKLKF